MKDVIITLGLLIALVVVLLGVPLLFKALGPIVGSFCCLPP